MADEAISVLHAGRDFYDPYEGLAERGLYDLDEDLLGLSYPGDCKCKILRKYAEKCGLKVTDGGSHYVVKDPDTNIIVMFIPHSVKANGACRSIINVLNDRCEDKYYDSYAAYDSYNGKEY